MEDIISFIVYTSSSGGYYIVLVAVLKCMTFKMTIFLNLTTQKTEKYNSMSKFKITINPVIYAVILFMRIMRVVVRAHK